MLKTQPSLKDELMQQEETQNKDSLLYYTYLKSLSSKCTLIALTFTQQDLENFKGEVGPKIDILSPEEEQMVEKQLKSQEQGENKGKFFTKYAILLETRLSR